MDSAKEEHFNDRISMIYSTDCVPPSTGICTVPWDSLSVSENVDLQTQLVLNYVSPSLSFLQEKINVGLSA